MKTQVETGVETQAGARVTQTDIGKLPDYLQKLVRRLLVQGATFQDVVEAVEEAPGDGVTLQAVQDYFRRDLDIQQERIKRQVAAAKALREAAGIKLSPDDQKLGGEIGVLDAVILTGLMRLNRDEVEIDANDARIERLALRNLQLKRQTLRMERMKKEEECQRVRIKARAELARARLLEGKLKELRKTLKPVEKSQRLSPQAYQQIQEVYGLITAPIIIEERMESGEAGSGE